MFCNCCFGDEDINNLNGIFGRRYMDRDAESYLKNGLDPHSQRLIRPLIENNKEVSPLSVLEIGFGAGQIHQELLQRGIADRVVGVDVSEAGVAAAQRNAAKLGLGEKIDYYTQDFAQRKDEHERADVVILNKVICCYPYLDRLLGSAVTKVNRYLVLCAPQDVWWTRSGHWAADKFMAILRSKYRFFLHPQKEIDRLTADADLRPISIENRSIWRMVTYEKKGVGG